MNLPLPTGWSEADFEELVGAVSMTVGVAFVSWMLVQLQDWRSRQ